MRCYSHDLSVFFSEPLHLVICVAISELILLHILLGACVTGGGRVLYYVPLLYYLPYRLRTRFCTKYRLAILISVCAQIRVSVLSGYARFQ